MALTERMNSLSKHDGFGTVVAQPLSRRRQIAGRRLSESWTRIPHVTHFDEADITAIDALRKQPQQESPARPSVLAYIACAVAATLQCHRNFCAALDDDGKTLWLKQYVHLGIAVDTPLGLVVAVVTDADRKTPREVGTCITELGDAARAGRLKPAQAEGACFTISSLGELGGNGFTPVINPPNVAVLGIACASIRPEWTERGFEPRLKLPLCLSYDHRAIDGADAGRFFRTLKRKLEEVGTPG